VSRGKTVASKAQRKKDRNKSYAKGRVEIEKELERASKAGEVVMRGMPWNGSWRAGAGRLTSRMCTVDASELPVSKRQAKLAARAVAVREANSKKDHEGVGDTEEPEMEVD